MKCVWEGVKIVGWRGGEACGMGRVKVIKSKISIRVMMAQS